MFWRKPKPCAAEPVPHDASAAERNLCECEACRQRAALGAIERVCRASESRDPIEIAVAALRQPELRLHGGEHRAVVAGALVAALANVRGKPDAKDRWIAEVRRATLEAPAEVCPCDVGKSASVAHATGVYVATVNGDAGLARKATEAAAKLAAAVKGPPCCKRNSFLGILQAAHFTREHLGVELHARGPACEWYPKNKTCLLQACPFYRPNSA